MKGKKTIFANVVIAVCVAAALVVTLSVVWEYHRLNTVMPAGVISALFGLWGGELLIVALRQIFGSDVTRRDNSLTTNHSDNVSDVDSAGADAGGPPGEAAPTAVIEDGNISDLFGGSV